MLFDKALRSGQLSQSDQAIVAYISQHPQDVLHMTSRELAEAAFVSPATISRLCRKAGFESFNDMKVQLAREQADEESYERVDADFPALAGVSAAQVVTRVSSMEREALRKTERLLCGVDWAPIVHALDACGGICVYAMGFSWDACGSFVRNMRRLGRRVTLLEEYSGASQWAAVCGRDELFVLVSYSGSVVFTNDIAQVLRRRGVKSLSVTMEGTPLSSMTTWTIPLAMTERSQANDRIAHFQSVTSEEFALNVLYAMWFSGNYAGHTRAIAAALGRQGIKVKRSDRESPHIETLDGVAPQWMLGMDA